jgi:hypothetical protein
MGIHYIAQHRVEQPEAHRQVLPAAAVLWTVEGKSGADYRPLPTMCTYAHFPVTQVGDGYGIQTHIRDVLAHVVSALASPGTRPLVGRSMPGGAPP